MNTNFQIGDRVKYGESIIRSARDWWLGRGRHSEKTAAKDELDAKTAVRGTVTAIGRTQYGEYVNVTTDSGQEHHSTTHIWEKV
jgi:hypothetical protein